METIFLMFIQSDPKFMVRKAVLKKILEKQISISEKHCFFPYFLKPKDVS